MLLYSFNCYNSLLLFFREGSIMQKISLANLQPGMVVAKNIYDADANLLLSKDIVLTERYIKRLQTM